MLLKRQHTALYCDHILCTLSIAMYKQNHFYFRTIYIFLHILLFVSFTAKKIKKIIPCLPFPEYWPSFHDGTLLGPKYSIDFAWSK